MKGRKNTSLGGTEERRTASLLTGRMWNAISDKVGINDDEQHM